MILRLAGMTVMGHVVACFVLVIVLYGSPLYLINPKTSGSLAAVCVITAMSTYPPHAAKQGRHPWCGDPRPFLR